MSHIFGRRDRLQPLPLSEALQQEMYCSPYASQDWDKARNLCAKPDLYYPHPMVQVSPKSLPCCSGRAQDHHMPCYA